MSTVVHPEPDQTIDASPTLPDEALKAHLSALVLDYPGLRALIERKVRDPELAADLLQEAALTTLCKLKNGEIQHPEQAGGYLYRVALNHLRNYRRKDRSDITEPDGLEEIPDCSSRHASDLMLREQWSSLAAKLLAELPTARDRELLVRFYLDDQERDELCKVLCITEAHFHRVIFRARERFKALLERKGYSKRDLLSIAVAVSSVIGAIGSQRALQAPLVMHATHTAREVPSGLGHSSLP
jgi:RNA polymerase sigma-70 factor, ECF subfamily